MSAVKSGAATAGAGRKDCSLVPVWEVSAVLAPYVDRLRKAAGDIDEDWNLTQWTQSIGGLSPRQITRILSHEAPLVGLRVVDLICHAMDSPHLLQTFTFVPGEYLSYARQMAHDEYLAANDEDPPEDFLVRRSAELQALRDEVLAKASVALKA